MAISGSFLEISITKKIMIKFPLFFDKNQSFIYFLLKKQRICDYFYDPASFRLAIFQLLQDSENHMPQLGLVAYGLGSVNVPLNLLLICIDCTIWPTLWTWQNSILQISSKFKGALAHSRPKTTRPCWGMRFSVSHQLRTH